MTDSEQQHHNPPDVSIYERVARLEAYSKVHRDDIEEIKTTSREMKKNVQEALEEAKSDMLNKLDERLNESDEKRAARRTRLIVAILAVVTPISSGGSIFFFEFFKNGAM